MILQPMIGATIFDSLQIILELVLFVLLIFAVSKTRLSKIDYSLLAVFLISSFISILLNDYHTAFLNFKIFGLCILVLIYYRKHYFNPSRLLFFFLLSNIAYAILAKVFNFWFFESSSFFVSADAFVFSRPVGFLGSPHSSTTFLIIYFLYLFYTNRSKSLQLVIFITLFLFSSWTAVLGLVIQLLYIISCRILARRINPFLFLAVVLGVAYLMLGLILNFASGSSELRSGSLEVMGPMIFDPSFYKDGFPLYPKSHDLLIAQQESTFADVGNEMGLIKIFTEGGIFLAFITCVLIIKRANYFVIFFLVTLFHYNFFVNMPFILYVSMTYNKDILDYFERKSHQKLNYLLIE